MYLKNSCLQEQKRTDRLTGILFSGFWIMTLLFFIQEPLLRNSTLGVLIWVLPTVCLLLLSLRIFRHIGIVDFVVLYAILAQIVLVGIANRVIYNKTLIFNLFRFMTLMISVMYCSYTKINKKILDVFFVCAVLSALLFLIYSFTPIATKYEASRFHEYGYIPDYFVFNFNNPNTAAFFLFGIYCTLLVNLPYRKHRLLLLALLAACMWMIFKTECRSCFLVSIAVTIIFLFFSHSRIPGWVAMACILVPLLFVYFYMALYYRAGDEEIVFLGKSLFSGRKEVYQTYLNYIQNPFQLLFGNFAKAKLNNAHNAPLTVFSSFGLYGLICFYAVLVPVVFRIKSTPKSRITTASVACLLGLFIISSSEAVAFLGTFPGIVFINSFILMANFTEKMPEKRQSEIMTMAKESTFLQHFKT